MNKLMQVFQWNSIRKRLYWGFGIMLVLLLFLGSVGLTYISKVNGNYTHLLNEQVKSIGLVKDLNSTIQAEHATVSDYIVSGKSGKLDKYKEYRLDFNEVHEQLMELVTDRDKRQILQGLDLLQEQFIAKSDLMIDAKNKGNQNMITTTAISQGEVLDKFVEVARSLVDSEQAATNAKITSTQAQVKFTSVIIFVISLFALVLGITVAVVISSQITKPIMKLQAAAVRIAERDLTIEKIDIKNKDELGDLANAFNLMTDNLRHLIQEIGFHAEQYVL